MRISEPQSILNQHFESQKNAFGSSYKIISVDDKLENVSLSYAFLLRERQPTDLVYLSYIDQNDASNKGEILTTFETNFSATLSLKLSGNYKFYAKILTEENAIKTYEIGVLNLETILVSKFTAHLEGSSDEILLVVDYYHNLSQYNALLDITNVTYEIKNDSDGTILLSEQSIFNNEQHTIKHQIPSSYVKNYDNLSIWVRFYTSQELYKMIEVEL